MKRTDSLPELLSPCGSPESIPAAIAGGADAVYFGGTLLNARMNAKNFGREETAEAIKRCHDAGVKVYVTLNTLVLDRELPSIPEYAGFLYDSGCDALIVADTGLAVMLSELFPDFPLHASTQAGGHSVAGAEALAALGFSRMVCAREMSREDIRTLIDRSPLEIEMFVHGAHCVSCSGQCLMSGMLGGRSGNRGQCAQPCRMQYNGSYPLSLKDMCLARHIPDIIASGVSSLKIEGRMKSPAYVYGVTRIYRRLLDEGRAPSASEMKELEKLFSRSGFTDAYYTKSVSQSMLGVRSEKNISDSREASSAFKPVRKPGAPVVLNREKAEYDASSFVMKRTPVSGSAPYNTAFFREAKQIPETDYFKHIYLPLAKFEKCAADGIILPAVIFDSELPAVRAAIERAVKNGAKEAMISNIGQLSLTAEYGLNSHFSYRMNIFGSYSGRAYEKYSNVKPVSELLSPELNLPQIRDIRLPEGVDKGAVVYGRLPLMYLEKPTGQRELRDSRGARFPILTDGKRETVFNSVPIYMADQPERLDGAGIVERAFLFTTEDRAEAMRIIYAYRHKQPPKERMDIRRVK